MNQFIGIGNLTAKPEQHTTQNGDLVATFTIAIQRKYKNAQGQYDADFIRCVCWRKSAEFIGKYGDKGRKCAVVGELQTRSYEKDGQKHSVIEVNVHSVEFCDRKPSEQAGTDKGEFVEVADDSLPF